MTHDAAFTRRQFPIDPVDKHVPWSLHPVALLDVADLVKQRSVLVVLGEPPINALTPLLYSPNLAASLIIIATSRTYSIPPSITPAIRILSLAVPLGSSDSAPSRLATILQLAHSTAAVWRASPHPPPFGVVLEDTSLPGNDTPPQRASWFSSSSALPSPASSDAALTPAPARRRSSPPSSDPPRGRLFDALLNFLPADPPTRHLLKYAILVTTLSRPFLDMPAPDPGQPAPPRRFSLRPRLSSITPSPTAPSTNTTAHLIHLIPPTHAALTRPLESFCLSFTAASPTPASYTPRPFVMFPAALSDVLHVRRRAWSLVELVLCGALDGNHAPRRAWLKGAGHVKLLDHDSNDQQHFHTDEFGAISPDPHRRPTTWNTPVAVWPTPPSSTPSSLSSSPELRGEEVKHEEGESAGTTSNRRRVRHMSGMLVGWLKR